MNFIQLFEYGSVSRSILVQKVLFAYCMTPSFVEQKIQSLESLLRKELLKLNK
jgi:hypothetical protein